VYHPVEQLLLEAIEFEIGIGSNLCDDNWSTFKLWRVDFEPGTNDSAKIVSVTGSMANNRGSDKLTSKIITNRFLIEGLSNG